MYWNARIAGKWCSNWCCCDSHSANVTAGIDEWHGERCNDLNECASSPCKNRGNCTESSTDTRVNNYFRKYRCECTTEYTGHNCQTRVQHDLSPTGCALGQQPSPSNFNSYSIFRSRLKYLDIITSHHEADFDDFCGKFYDRMTQGGACGTRFILTKKASTQALTKVTLDCKGNHEMFVAAKLCMEPCMETKGGKTGHCCMMPSIFASRFACCRQMKCCQDQRPRARTGVAGQTPFVYIEVNTASVQTATLLLDCMRTQSPAKCTALAIDTGKPRVVPLIANSSIVKCSHGKQVSCVDGIKNGDEPWIDYGGSCGKLQHARDPQTVQFIVVPHTKNVMKNVAQASGAVEHMRTVPSSANSGLGPRIGPRAASAATTTDSSVATVRNLRCPHNVILCFNRSVESIRRHNGIVWHAFGSPLVGKLRRARLHGVCVFVAEERHVGYLQEWRGGGSQHVVPACV